MMSADKFRILKFDACWEKLSNRCTKPNSLNIRLATTNSLPKISTKRLEWRGSKRWIPANIDFASRRRNNFWKTAWSHSCPLIRWCSCMRFKQRSSGREMERTRGTIVREFGRAAAQVAASQQPGNRPLTWQPRISTKRTLRVLCTPNMFGICTCISTMFELLLAIAATKRTYVDVN